MTLAAFVEDRIDLGVDTGTSGGPEFQTTIIVNGGGWERRNINWSAARGRWQLGERTINVSEKDYLTAFFRQRRGRAVGFRYKDWADWNAIDEALAAPDGTPTGQLIKTYGSGADLHVRDIVKPVAGSVAFKRNGAAYASPVLDITTGLITFASDEDHTITGTGITLGNPTMIEVDPVLAITYNVGDLIYLDGIGGTVELNGAPYAVTAFDNAAHTVTLNVDSTNFTAWTAAGTLHKYPQPADVITWSGEFDVPVRFDIDQIQMQLAAYRSTDNAAYFDLASLPIVEIRL